MKKRQIHEDKRERGQVLVIALIVMMFGALVVGTLLDYVNSSILVAGSGRDRLHAYYAADAGIEAIIAQLAQGDRLDDLYNEGVTYQIFLDSSNVTLTPSPGGNIEPNGYKPDITLDLLDPSGGKFNVQNAEGTALGTYEVGVGFSDAAAIDTTELWCKVIDTPMVGGPTVVTITYTYVDQEADEPNHTGTVTIDPDADVGTSWEVTLQDVSKTVNDVVAIKIKGEDPPNSKDYVITSTTGSVIVKCELRQQPYPGNGPPYTVIIFSYDAWGFD